MARKLEDTIFVAGHRGMVGSALVRRLKECGYKFIGPKKGMLACGKKGTGCLEDVDVIVGKVKAGLLSSR